MDLSVDAELNSLLDDAQSSSVIASNLEIMRKRIQDRQNSKNYKYLRCVLFPEFSKGARFPGGYSTPSHTFTLEQEYQIKVTEGMFGIAVNPYAVSTGDSVLYNFSQIQYENWGRGDSKYQVLAQSSTPLISPEVGFSSYRLIGCSVTASGVSEKSFGFMKGGIEYDVSPDFIGPDMSIPQNVIGETLLVHAAEATRHVRMLANLRKDCLAHRNAAIAAAGGGGPVPLDMKITEETLTVDDYTEYLMTIIGSHTSVCHNNKTFLEDISNVLAQVDFVPRDVLSRRAEWLASDDIYKTMLKIYKRKNSGVRATRRYGVIFYFMELVLCYELGYKVSEGEFNYTTPNGHIANTPDSIRNVVPGATNAAVYRAGCYSLAEVIKRLADNTNYHMEDFYLKSKTRFSLPGFRNLDSDSLQAGPLCYKRLNLVHYKQEVAYEDGIRVVYVPRMVQDLRYDTFPKDFIFIGGDTIPENATIRIKVKRHFEGIVHQGMESLYPPKLELEDEEMVKTLHIIIKRYPNLLKITPRNLQSVYELVKKTFKWVDTALKEDGGNFALVKDFDTEDVAMVDSGIMDTS